MKDIQLPLHGRVACHACFGAPVEFDRARRTEGEWRITANPLAWGNPQAEVIVLGFSKGPNQAGALERVPHDEIAFRGGRGNVGKILHHIGVLEMPSGVEPKDAVSRAIADRKGRFHFGSLAKCTVERNVPAKGGWVGTSASMLGDFVVSPLGRDVMKRCAERHLKVLPPATKLVVLFGLGTKLAYVRECFALFQAVRGGEWRWLPDNAVAYTDGKITVVHVEHFKSQGAYIPQWLGERDHPRAEYGKMAQAGVRHALG